MIKICTSFNFEFIIYKDEYLLTPANGTTKNTRYV